MRKLCLASIGVATTSVVAISVLSVAVRADANSGRAVRYIALGDSYSSGVGAGSYSKDSGDCERSSKSYPALWAEATSPASFTSVACSGATTSDVKKRQLSALSEDTTLVSLTVGGNDIGFTKIMGTCVISTTVAQTGAVAEADDDGGTQAGTRSGSKACFKAIDAAKKTIRTTLPDDLDEVYDGIASQAPKARVIVLGYPLFYELGTQRAGLDDEVRAGINSGIDLLDSEIEAAASRHDFTFVDVRSSFDGHQLCSSDEWLHGLDLTRLTQSYHPTANGHSDGYYPAFKAAAAKRP